MGSPEKIDPGRKPDSQQVQRADGPCRRGSHTVAAKLFGATDEEIEEAMHVTKQFIGWSTYINGMQLDYDEFKKEMDRVAEHVKSMMAAH